MTKLNLKMKYLIASLFLVFTSVSAASISESQHFLELNKQLDELKLKQFHPTLSSGVECYSDPNVVTLVYCFSDDSVMYDDSLTREEKIKEVCSNCYDIYKHINEMTGNSRDIRNIVNNDENYAFRMALHASNPKLSNTIMNYESGILFQFMDIDSTKAFLDSYEFEQHTIQLNEASNVTGE